MSIFSRFSNWCRSFRFMSSTEKTPREKALLHRAILAMLEDVISWENPRLSLGFLAFVNIVFLVFIQMDITFTECLFIMGMMYICLDGVEMWLRRKHRTVCLERLAQCEHVRLQYALTHTASWLGRQKDNFLAMREVNPTKAFLVANIMLGVLFVIGKNISGILLLYLMFMLTLLYPVYSVYIHHLVKRVHQASDSDAEIESLIPEMSEQNMKELNIETESVATRHSIDPWLPEGSPGRELSDSEGESGTSEGSLPAGATCLDTRDSDSSDDDYLPKLENEPRTTVQVTRGEGGDSARPLWALSATLTNLLYSARTNRQNVQLATPNADSSDDFEFLDQSDL